MRLPTLTLTLTLLLIACGTESAPEAPPAPEPAPVAEPAPAPPPAPAAAEPVVVKVGDAAAGEPIYTTNCTACHQADGTGMGGMLAADFTKEKERLAKPDEVLLTSIRDGVTSKRGAMPAWGAILSDQEMADVLAYIRKSFGGD